MRHRIHHPPRPITLYYGARHPHIAGAWHAAPIIAAPPYYTTTERADVNNNQITTTTLPDGWLQWLHAMINELQLFGSFARHLRLIEV